MCILLKESLIYHRKAFHSDTKYPCDKCDYIAHTKKERYKHRRRMHKVKIEMICSPCNLKFVSKANLSQHRNHVQPTIPHVLKRSYFV